jgi:preprotein translocase subunit SecB
MEGGVTDEGGPARPLEIYPIQITDVHCLRTSCRRRQRRPNDPDTPALDIQVKSAGLNEDGRGFGVALRVKALVPVLESEIAEVLVVVVGAFGSDDPIDPAVHAAFVANTPIVQLWPYARAYMAELGTMLGIALPPLPLINALARQGSAPATVEAGDTSAQD